MDGGSRREVPGTWSATLEWLVRRLAPELSGLGFVEVRYRVKSWRRLSWCVDDCRAALALAEDAGAQELALLGFSMGGAVAVAAAAQPRVTTVIALAPWIPDRLDLSTLEGRRLAIVHGALDRPLPGIPGVHPSRSLASFERIRERGVDATHTVLSGALHGLALRNRLSGGVVRLPRAERWARLVAAELERFQAGPGARYPNA